MEAVSFVQSQSIRKKLFKARLSSSPAKIWKSKISWRIALAVFMTILLVQTCILNFSTMENFENNNLRHLREVSTAAIVSLIDVEQIDMFSSPFDEEKIGQMLAQTKVTGLTVYGMALDNKSLALIKNYGENPVTTLYDINNTNRKYRSADGGRYEFVLRISNLNGSYFFVTRVDSAAVQRQLFEFVKETIIIMLLMSAFVTTVLMIALGHWLLEPILFLRSNLQEAVKNPENPEVVESPFDPHDEIGGAIETAYVLIHQNADNLKRIKSAAEDKIHRLAYYDTLTGLPNR
ncbi:MAG: bifunctional diguanylate cyclase/phosphodiesterase, partial [Micavibrio sp.]|nr:bifunctional diguanylate cyclase/phosphodiesterase [Micavibrio sp.]